MASVGGNVSLNVPGKIQRLEEAVVNRIAAGEVVQRPANAIKEMIENCLDAGANSIQVVVKDGGLKLIQIQDNGSGIRKEDMMIVCERFTTSKLRKFEDLSNISTYGFRGEALASISHVAHVTITTRTAESKCAYKASYRDGKLLPVKAGGPAGPRPCAGNQGTLIAAEDLFYNIPNRKRALKTSEEFNRISDVVTKYAIHNSGVAFTVKKGESVSAVRTLQTSSTKENITSLYGASIGRELLPVSCENARLGFKMNGFVTNANYSVKKLQFLLFINHRLVDSVSIRKGIEAVYGSYLPKNTHPFVYMSIEITPANIDVNVHPTKHEVLFLHEDVVVESVQKAVEESLLNCNESRTYFTQALLPVPVSLDGDEEEEKRRDKRGSTDKPSYAYQMVRTDAKEQKLDAFVVPRSLQLTAVQEAVADTPSPLPPMEYIHPPQEEEGTSGVEVEEAMELEEKRENESTEVEPSGVAKCQLSGEEDSNDHCSDRKIVEKSTKMDSSSSTKTSLSTASRPLPAEKVGLLQNFSRRKSRRREVNLTSVLNLQHSVRSQQHRDLTDLFHNHTFVGCVDQIRALVQHQTKLYIVDLSRVTKELFYQLVLFDFANFGFLKLTPPASLFDLVMLALNLPESEWTPEHGPKEKIAQYVADLLKEKAQMLKDYFSMEIGQDGHIYSLPMLLNSYSPNLDRLPLFILRLATEVNWEEEKECFQSLANECGLFYGLQHDPLLLDSSEEEQKTEKKKKGERNTGEESTSSSDTGRGKKTEASGGEETVEDEPDKDQALYKREPWRWTVEHVIFPALRSDLIPQRKMATDGSLLQIADLHELYKVFERC